MALKKQYNRLKNQRKAIEKKNNTAKAERNKIKAAGAKSVMKQPVLRRQAKGVTTTMKKVKPKSPVKGKKGSVLKRAGSWLKKRQVKKAAKKKQKAVNKGYKKRAKQSKKNLRKINKMVTRAEKKKPGSGMKKVKLAGVAKRDPSKISAHGKIRRGVKSVTMTGGGAFASYKKKSKAAKSFRSAFSDASKKGQKTFKWDGRSYTTKKKAAPKKKKK